MNLNNHPCFNDKKRHIYARVHLPVAPKCNIQCNYCVRKYDCINESKPGVTSGVLKPEEAIVYLEKVMKTRGNISVTGIAGPGDPFANPEETMEALRLVRAKYEGMMLCVATNGLNIGPYIEELAELKVSHITITINAAHPSTGAKIYSWVRDGKRIYHKEEAAALLIERQLDAVKRLKEKGITVKINTIIVPGINSDHILDVVHKVKELGADIMNCIPMITNAGSVFENIDPPEKSLVDGIRKEISFLMPQMTHCARCRADAVGLIGEEMGNDDFEILKSVAEEKFENPDKNHIAVGTREGMLINRHLGEIDRIYVYSNENGKVKKVDVRKAPAPGSGDARWHDFAEIIKDCAAILVSGTGENPEKIFLSHGIRIIKTEGLIEIVLSRLFAGKKIFEKKNEGCGKGLSCTGSGSGCG